ncbi:MAG: tetratricopeptide repeat protein [Planctomycetota bacterium]
MRIPATILVLCLIVATTGCGGDDDDTAAAPLTTGGDSVETPVAVDSSTPADAASAWSWPDDIVIAMAHIGQQEFEPAQSIVDAYRAAHPDDPAGTFCAGLILHKQKQYADALPLLEDGWMPGRNDGALHFIGWCRYYLGDLNGAIEAFDAHLDVDQFAVDSLYGSGIAILEKGEPLVARLRFQDAINRDKRKHGGESSPAVAKAYLRLGEMDLADGQYDQAIDNLTQCLLLDERLVPAYFALSQVYARTGDEDQAEHYRAQYEAMQAQRESTGGIQP